jgi:hypothetical protein
VSNVPTEIRERGPQAVNAFYVAAYRRLEEVRRLIEGMTPTNRQWVPLCLERAQLEAVVNECLESL